MSRRDRHAAFHVLLARRVDGALSGPDETALEAHLAGCPACRGVAKAYLAQREMLQGLPALDPPRDLWARTATALDHEVARARRRPAMAAWGSLASLVVVLALVASQAGLLQLSAPEEAAAATPIPVTPQPIAFITRQGGELTIFEAQVNEVCPPPRYDCTARAADTRALLRVNTSLEPSDLALGTDGRLVITGRDAEGHAIYSVLELPPSEASEAPQTPTAPARQSPTAPASGRSGATPSAPGSASPSGGVSPPPSASPSTVIKPPPSPSGAPTTAPAEAKPILTDVIAAGAPAAWSPDGTTLAFSAMPADGSRGPDIYTWHPGQPVARVLTRDHRSWFASWVGKRVLLSRTPAVAARGKAPSASPSASDSSAAGLVAQTVLLDPASGASRPVALERAWLPSVDPTGRFAIFFQGSLVRDGTSVRPGASGRLLMADWRALDPFAPKPASGAPSGSPSARTATPSAGAPTTAATLSSGRAAPRGGDEEEGATLPSASSTPAEASDDGPFAPFTLATPSGYIADWLVRWSADGSAYGLWVASAPDSEAGTLLVAAPRAGPEYLLDPTPALRAFSLGDGHVAWVAPTSADDGELRVAAWGAGGSGGVRVRQVGSGTLAF